MVVKSGDNFVQSFVRVLCHECFPVEGGKERNGKGAGKFKIISLPSRSVNARRFRCGFWCVELVFEYFFTPGHPEADEIVKVSEEVALEDLTIAESVQRNLHAGIYRKGLLSPRHENGLVDFKELLTEVLAGSPLLP